MRRGLTLFEVLLVLTLLIILGALSMPAMEGAFSQSRLRHAGDQVRAVWSQARQAALESGQAQSFRCVWASGQFHVQPMEGLVPSATGAINQLPEVTIEPDDGLVDDHWSGDRLTGGIIFATGTWASVFAQQAAAVNTNNSVPEGEWSDPIYFFPDGTTTDATLILTNDRDRQLRLTLRGITGISLASEANLESNR